MTNIKGVEQRVLEVTAGMDSQAIIDLLGAMRGLLRDRGLEPGCDQARDPRPSRMFFVPEGVRYLDSMQIEALTRAIDAWAKTSRTPQIHFSRQRLRLVYLMLRHSGAKVGEVLTLDDTRDLDFEANEVIIRGGSTEEIDRRVVLPKRFMDEVRRFLDTPGALGLRGRIFRLDQGFVRRKISEQCGRVPFSRELLNPTVLRHSRAVELLRQGVPLPVVQRLLGHASVVLTSGYYAFSEGDSKRILNHYVQKEPVMRTSARNTFLGTVSAVRSGEVLTEVVLRTKSGKEIVSVITGDSARNLGISEGKNLAAIIKAPFVLLAKEEGKSLMSTRNRFPATVTKIHGDDVAVEVTGALDDGTTMCALITDESVDNLSLKLGDTVWFFFKAMSVILIAE
ncbi:MAG: TOBE domain-containing protein [Humidesulfovibrio sp.]|nr:TOBE domain-containing protein [Humidesulfovibrio sp.]